MALGQLQDEAAEFLDRPTDETDWCRVGLGVFSASGRPAVIQRKVTNGYRAMWAAQGEAAVRTVVDTARLGTGPPVFGTILSTVTA